MTTDPIRINSTVRITAIHILSFSILLILTYAAGQTGIPVEDGGEFLTVARLGGVNHPPGLPLLSLFSRSFWTVFGRLSLRFLFAAIAASALFLVNLKTKSISVFVFSAGVLLLPAITGRLLMWDAYSPLFLLFAAALVRNPSFGLEGGYLTGLALAVHPQGVLLPILFRKKSIEPLKFAAGLTLGLSLYLALPLLSEAGAIVDWGNTETVGNFIRQVTAGGYREAYGGSMGKASLDVLFRHLLNIFRILWPVLLLPTVLGIFKMIHKQRRTAIRLLVLMGADFIFVLLINPMAAGTTQTAILTLFSVVVFAFFGIRTIEKWNKKAGLAAGLAAVAAGVLLFAPLEDQSADVESYFADSPLRSGIFISNNDLLYGGWVLKYVEDRRPDLVLLSTGNFSGWFEEMAEYFNPNLDLSSSVTDVGNYHMEREELASRLMDAIVKDNPDRVFFVVSGQ
ncbi:MAG: hypothetical protein GF388_11145 [Candidatus Aegiribacteria sp.]|nr:hypothetical protein [Candidatus Aegiribacteria sp.]